MVCIDVKKSARKEGYEKDIQTDTDDVFRQEGGRAEYLDCDVTKASDVQTVVDRTVSAFGLLEVMVNNAGVFTGLHTIVDETKEQYDFTMAVNAKDVWLGCKFAIAQIRRDGDRIYAGVRWRLHREVRRRSSTGLDHRGGEAHTPLARRSEGEIVAFLRPKGVLA